MERDDQKFEEYARLLAEECDQQEKQRVLSRLEHDPEEKRVFEKLRLLWSDFSPEINSADAIWQKTVVKLGFATDTKKKTKSLRILLRYAAAAVLLISFGLNAYFVTLNWFAGQAELIEYSTKTGEVRKIVLSDGSRVWLNSESTLILPQHFEGKNRNVFLQGEAFFKVEKNPDKPFLVNTQSLTVKVLGTSFGVRNYQNDQEINTSLEEGKVELFNKAVKGDNIILEPSEEAVFNKADGKITVRKKSEILIAPWRDGSFRFYNTDLLSIAHQLERKFDCQFVFVDEAAESLRFTADFENEGLGEILDLLNKAHSFKIKRSGKRYIISVGDDSQKKDSKMQ